MKRKKNGIYLSIIGIGLFLILGCSQKPKNKTNELIVNDHPRSQLLFDFDWRFHRGDVAGGEEVDFDDSQWRLLNLPHDWSIEDLPGTDSPLDSNAVGGIDIGYFVGGTGWYRKKFTIPSELKGKRFNINFEGVYMNADIWLNGEYLGNHPYGYTSFWYDISENLIFGEENLVAVKVSNEGKNSRWYSGSGIYRHVWLTVTEPLYIAPWGTYITTPEVSNTLAQVDVKTKVVNDSDKSMEVTLVTIIINRKGEETAKVETKMQIEAASSMEISQNLAVRSPELWSPESPNLYIAATEIIDSDSQVLDKVETTFGIRTIEFTVEEGFLLNGKPTLLKGGCMHHGNGPLGSAAYDRAEERRVELMKASGFNSIRCAHNPPSPAFLDACDKLGILVINEAFDMWKKGKKQQDYHLYFDQWWQKDIESMILRDRNHPSIIMWSTGNEIPERGEPEGVKTSQMLAEFVRDLDPTRPVTSAVNGLRPDKDPYFATLDIAGYNYSFGGDHGKQSIFEIDHNRLPNRIIYCSESYPLEAFGAWMDVIDYPYVIGDFVWTGFDYLGEASIGWLGYPHEGSFYPWNHAFCGDIDICGFKRPQSYYRNVLWNAGQQVSIFVKPPKPSFKTNPGKKDWSKWEWQDVVAEWNWGGYENQPLEVEVYCAFETVELFLNGESLGKKETNRGTQWIAKWEVPYKPGILKAVAYEGTKEAGSRELVTAEDPNNIRLSADRAKIKADGQDLSYITVDLLDSNDRRHPKAENLIRFEIEGPGSIIAVASSNPMSVESYQQPKRKAYKGRCLVIVKSTRESGNIIIKASSTGLQSARLIIISEEVN
ncbi:MAG: DUF4982 domain-containing protein [Bacteroidetes bacterium]|nr:DUF4982 domain-containing protein [Bacteroidota bacterium]